MAKKMLADNIPIDTITKYTELTREEIDGIVKTIVSTVPVLEIYLFGSSANGTAKEDSDYDFYVVIPDDGARAREATWKIQSAIRNRTRGIDMFVNTKSRFDKYKNISGRPLFGGNQNA